MRPSSVLAVVGLVVGATLVAVPAHAGPPGHRPPPGPVCGAVLTSDTRLRADLTCAEGDGLVLAAGVTLDLRGHTLRGPGGGTGVVVPAQGDVTIRNGTLTGWGSGVAVAASVDDEGQGGDVVLDKVTITGNQRGVAADGDLPYASSKDFLVQRSTLTRNGTAIHTIFGSVHVVGSTLKDNPTGLDADTSGVLVDDSRIERNSTGATCYEAAASCAA